MLAEPYTLAFVKVIEAFFVVAGPVKAASLKLLPQVIAPIAPPEVFTNVTTSFAPLGY